jgi:hypothetical protein
LTVASGGILVSLDPGAARKVLELYATSTGAKVSSSYVGASSYGNLELLTSGLARLTISDTGISTFSSSVTATNSVIVTSSDTLGTNLNLINTSAGGYNWNIFSGGSSGTLAPVGSLIFRDSTNGASRMVINSAGNVGINTATPSQQFSVKKVDNGTDAIASFSANNLSQQVEIWYAGVRAGGTSTNVDLYLSSKNAGSVVCETNGTERMRITSGGFLKASNTGSYINSTGAFHELNSDQGSDFSLYVKNSSASAEGIVTQLNSSSSTITFFGGYSTSDSAYKFLARTNGDVKNATGVYGTISSDIRLKENILDATSKLEDIMKLRVVNFNLLGKEEKHIGFIAQEMQEVFPSLVDQNDTRQYDEDGNLISGLEDALGVKVGMEFAILVKVIQELKTEIDSLKNQIK